jgi:hypothetical protein
VAVGMPHRYRNFCYRNIPVFRAGTAAGLI